MILETKQSETNYTRTSKLGVRHHYTRSKTLVLIQCDNCKSTFERELGKMDHRRLSNNYFHVCSGCDAKRFAQKVGVHNRNFWNIPADSDVDISKF
jgi:hypothetical protein